MDKKLSVDEKPKFYVVNFSGGKDSTAMLLRLLEEGRPIDDILFVDTQMEFPGLYEHVDKVEQNIGRPITRIRSDDQFEYLMFEKPVKRKGTAFADKWGVNHTGYGWAGPKMRWCTEQLKGKPIRAYEKQIKAQGYQIIHYVGLAADEGYRLERKNNQAPNHIHPLIDWGMTEADCLQYCYDRGYDWGGLYEQFKRVSCWCCPLQSLGELRILWEYYPELWAKLKDWDNRTWRSFKADYTVAGLEIRFQLEKEWDAQGNKLNTKAFYTEMRKRIEAAGVSAEQKRQMRPQEESTSND